MFSRSAVVIFSVMVVEFFVAAWVVGQVGVATTLLLLLAFAFLGVAVTRWKAAGLLMSTLRTATNPSAESTATIAGPALGLLAGLLIGIPGFVSTAAGLLLLLAPVRSIVEQRLAARATSWSVPFLIRSGPNQRPGPRGRSGEGTIIDVDLVGRDQVHQDQADNSDVDDEADEPQSARPEIG